MAVGLGSAGLAVGVTALQRADKTNSELRALTASTTTELESIKKWVDSQKAESVADKTKSELLAANSELLASTADKQTSAHITVSYANTLIQLYGDVPHVVSFMLADSDGTPNSRPVEYMSNSWAVVEFNVPVIPGSVNFKMVDKDYKPNATDHLWAAKWLDSKRAVVSFKRSQTGYIYVASGYANQKTGVRGVIESSLKVEVGVKGSTDQQSLTINQLEEVTQAVIRVRDVVYTVPSIFQPIFAFYARFEKFQIFAVDTATGSAWEYSSAGWTKYTDIFETVDHVLLATGVIGANSMNSEERISGLLYPTAVKGNNSTKLYVTQDQSSVFYSSHDEISRSFQSFEGNGTPTNKMPNGLIQTEVVNWAAELSSRPSGVPTTPTKDKVQLVLQFSGPVSLNTSSPQVHLSDINSENKYVVTYTPPPNTKQDVKIDILFECDTTGLISNYKAIIPVDTQTPTVERFEIAELDKQNKSTVILKCSKPMKVGWEPIVKVYPPDLVKLATWSTVDNTVFEAAFSVVIPVNGMTVSLEGQLVDAVGNTADVNTTLAVGPLAENVSTDMEVRTWAKELMKTLDEESQPAKHNKTVFVSTNPKSLLIIQVSGDGLVQLFCSTKSNAYELVKGTELEELRKKEWSLVRTGDDLSVTATTEELDTSTTQKIVDAVEKLSAGALDLKVYKTGMENQYVLSFFDGKYGHKYYLCVVSISDPS